MFKYFLFLSSKVISSQKESEREKRQRKPQDGSQLFLTGWFKAFRHQTTKKKKQTWIDNDFSCGDRWPCIDISCTTAVACSLLFHHSFFSLPLASYSKELYLNNLHEVGRWRAPSIDKSRFQCQPVVVLFWLKNETMNSRGSQGEYPREVTDHCRDGNHLTMENNTLDLAQLPLVWIINNAPVHSNTTAILRLLSLSHLWPRIELSRREWNVIFPLLTNGWLSIN